MSTSFGRIASSFAGSSTNSILIGRFSLI